MPFATQAEIDKIKGWAPRHVARVVTADDLIDVSDRTLLLGFTVDRVTHHVYVQDGVIHRYLYHHNGAGITHNEGTILLNQIVPNKRIYPESLDREFVRLIALMLGDGHDLNMTTWSDERSTRAPQSQSCWGEIDCRRQARRDRDAWWNR